MYNTYNILMESISKRIKYILDEEEINYIFEEFELIDIKYSINESNLSYSKEFNNIRKRLVLGIKKIWKSKGAKKARELAKEYNERLGIWLKTNKSISCPRYFYIVVTCLSLYGGKVIVNDLYDTIKSIKQEISDERHIKNGESIDDDIFIDINDSDEDIKKLENSISSPSEFHKENPTLKLNASKKAINYIKRKEDLYLYPYYATKSEEAQGKVTIGYGHVITKNDNPKLISKIKQLQKEGKITRMWLHVNGKYIINPTHAPEIITQREADELFAKDLDIAENRVKESLSFMNLDQDVLYYILYNQDLFDALTSLCYNAGYLAKSNHTSNYRLMNGLKYCRFDKRKNKIVQSDFDLIIPKFKITYSNKALTQRRQEEYAYWQLSNANKPFNGEIQIN